MVENRRARWWAFACSFLVYLLPLVGPHGTFTFALALLGELTDAGGERRGLWLAADFAAALGAQAAAGLVFAWFFHRPGWKRALALPPVAVALPLALSRVYLIVLPAAFLIEADNTPDQGAWSQVCVIPDAVLDTVRSPAALALERAGEALLVRGNNSGRLLLRMPGCEQRELNLGGASLGGTYLVPGGKVLYYRQEPGSAGLRWWYLAGPGARPQFAAEPENAFRYGGQPVLSSDGEWIAWVRWDPQAPQVSPRVLLRSIHGEVERTVSLAAASPASFTLLSVDTAAKTLLLARNESQVLEVSFDGAARPIPLELGDVKPLANTIRVVGDGWVAWDGYKERDSYRIAWSLAGGKGTHRVPRARLVESVAVDPAGRLLALSIGTSISLGNFGDAVYVRRASDGATVFRRNLPRYARSQVAFLGSAFFAYTNYDSAHTQVRVLRVPED